MASADKQLIGNMKPPQNNLDDPTSVHDRIIKVEEKTFYVHSAYLSIWSEYFRTMFEGSFEEANEKEIVLNDVSADSFGNFLNLIYPGRFDIKDDNLTELMILSDRFESPGAMDLCQKYLAANSSKMDKIDLLECAVKFGLEDIKAELAVYLHKNHSKEVRSCECHGSNEYYNCSKQKCIAYECYVPQGSLLANNRERISKLSIEAQAFIFQAIMKTDL